eukprot:9807902-Lingulodinium_polyedra.AAC.1
MIATLCVATFQSGVLPEQAVVNMGIRIGKKQISQDSVKQVCAQGRNIHCYTPFMQALLRAVCREGARPDVPHWSFGAIPKRQREEAIFIQLMNQY